MQISATPAFLNFPAQTFPGDEAGNATPLSEDGDFAAVMANDSATAPPAQVQASEGAPSQPVGVATLILPVKRPDTAEPAFAPTPIALDADQVSPPDPTGQATSADADEFAAPEGDQAAVVEQLAVAVLQSNVPTFVAATVPVALPSGAAASIDAPPAPPIDPTAAEPPGLAEPPPGLAAASFGHRAAIPPAPPDGPRGEISAPTTLLPPVRHPPRADLASTQPKPPSGGDWQERFGTNPGPKPAAGLPSDGSMKPTVAASDFASLHQDLTAIPAVKPDPTAPQPPLARSQPAKPGRGSPSVNSKPAIVADIGSITGKGGDVPAVSAITNAEMPFAEDGLVAVEAEPAPPLMAIPALNIEQILVNPTGPLPVPQAGLAEMAFQTGQSAAEVLVQDGLSNGGLSTVGLADGGLDPQATASTVVDIGEQILRALPTRPGVVEMTLTPEDLGRIRFEIQQSGDLVRMVLSAERPETLDHIRRQLPEFLAELRQAGFSGSDINLGQWTRGSGDNTPAWSGAFHDSRQNGQAKNPNPWPRDEAAEAGHPVLATSTRRNLGLGPGQLAIRL